MAYDLIKECLAKYRSGVYGETAENIDTAGRLDLTPQRKYSVENLLGVWKNYQNLVAETNQSVADIAATIADEQIRLEAYTAIIARMWEITVTITALVADGAVSQSSLKAVAASGISLLTTVQKYLDLCSDPDVVRIKNTVSARVDRIYQLLNTRTALVYYDDYLQELKSFQEVIISAIITRYAKMSIRIFELEKLQKLYTISYNTTEE